MQTEGNCLHNVHLAHSSNCTRPCPGVLSHSLLVLCKILLSCFASTVWIPHPFSHPHMPLHTVSRTILHIESMPLTCLPMASTSGSGYASGRATMAMPHHSPSPMHCPRAPRAQPRSLTHLHASSRHNESPVSASMASKGSFAPVLMTAACVIGSALPAHALELLAEPANALSLPTWAIHVSSVVEWVTAMVSGIALLCVHACGLAPTCTGSACVHACTLP